MVVPNIDTTSYLSRSPLTGTKCRTNSSSSFWLILMMYSTSAPESGLVCARRNEPPRILQKLSVFHAPFLPTSTTPFLL
jgi:hypothetical protein